ncbi:MAG: hypothetical protein DMF68_01620 [Acidobacteria bacterium]|nr:MAG: hypothetical protein DMF68_01620 [Acidobacteriota bacterium]
MQSPEFKWNAKREEAASLVAEDSLTDEQIAERLKINRATLHRWKTHPDFEAKVREIVEETRSRLLARGILAKQNRLEALRDRQERMTEVIERRAVENKDYPGGGATGLIVRDVKGIGKGEDFERVEVYMVDTSLLKELREHEKQAAIELGEWQERSTSLKVDLSNCTDDELERIANGEDPARVLAASRRGRA